MMTTDKPARMITRLTESLHAKDAEIAALKKELAAQRTRLDATTSLVQATEDARLAAQQAAEHLSDELIKLDELNAAATRALEEMETKCQAAVTALRSSEVMRLAAVAERDMLATQLAEVAPQIAHIEAQRVALTKILDGVRDRMRRKELDEERAILNRRALANVVPQRNFR